MPLQTYQTRIDSLTVVAESLHRDVHRRQRQTDTLVVTVQKRGQRVTQSDTALSASLDTARRVLADGDSNFVRLRATLTQVVAQAERYRLDVHQYQLTIDSLLTAQIVERAVTNAHRDALEAVIATQRNALAATQCRTVLRWCPSRWQAFGFGVFVTTALVIGL